MPAISFLLPISEHNAGLPHIVVRPATPPTPEEKCQAELSRDWFLERRAEYIRNGKRAAWARDCAAKGRSMRRDSLDGLEVITCARKAKKSVGEKVKRWIGEHCHLPRASVGYVEL